MSEPSRLRKVVGGVESGIAPPINRATRSKEFAQVLSITISVRKSTERLIGRGAARFWHALNLPAGTDVRRLRELVADLDRQLRHLQHQLDAQQAQQARQAQQAQPEQRGASRGPTDSVGDGADAERPTDAGQAGDAAQRPEGA
jgi:hypothetical protein